MKKALIVVDVQYDFLEGGALEVPYANEIISKINKILPNYRTVICTRDFHPANHKSFASQHEGHSTFDMIKLNGLNQILWPDHCVQGSRGSDLCDDLQLQNCKNLYIFKKGMDVEVDSYSAFFDNGGKNSSGLSEFLKKKGIDCVDVVGLAGDYCAKFTAIDAAKEGFNTTVLLDAVRFIEQNSKGLDKHYKEMLDNNVTLYMGVIK